MKKVFIFTLLCVIALFSASSLKAQTPIKAQEPVKYSIKAQEPVKKTFRSRNQQQVQPHIHVGPYADKLMENERKQNIGFLHQPGYGCRYCDNASSGGGNSGSGGGSAEEESVWIDD